MVGAVVAEGIAIALTFALFYWRAKRRWRK